MQIKFVKERSLQAVGPQGPFTRVFAIGEVVDMPEISAQSWLADGGAVIVPGKPVKEQPAAEAVETESVDEIEADQPAPKRNRK
jgi:protein-L-isoaspartate O-methyltransferase